MPEGLSLQIEDRRSAGLAALYDRHQRSDR